MTVTKDEAEGPLSHVIRSRDGGAAEESLGRVGSSAGAVAAVAAAAAIRKP